MRGQFWFTVNPGRKVLAGLGDGEELSFKCTAETADGRAKKEGGQVKVVFTYVHKYKLNPEVDQYNDEYTFESTDGAYSRTLDARSDSISGDDRVTIPFPDVPAGKTYTLVYRNRKNGETHTRFSQKPFHELFGQPKEGT